MILKILKRVVQVRNILGTLFIFLVIWILGSLPISTDFLDPIGQAIGDFDITDIIFSRAKQDTDVNFQDEVIIVNLGDSRPFIAEQIKKINQYSPKVIGVDAFFFSDKGPMMDSTLADVFKNSDNIVLANLLKLDENAENFDDIVEVRKPHEKFLKHVQTGYVNMISDPGSYRTVRECLPAVNFKDSLMLSFASQIVKMYDPDAFQTLTEREFALERINYISNIYMEKTLQNSTPEEINQTASIKYRSIQAEEIFFPEFDEMMKENNIFKNKIVLLGFFDQHANDLNDKFYTPLNYRYTGKSYPDMYGVVIHANIISMIINNNYINKMSDWFSYFLAFLLCHLNVVVFSYIHDRHETWFDLFTRSLQLIQMLIYFLIIIWTFYDFRYMVNFTLLIVAVLLSGDLMEIYLDLYRKFVFKKKVKQHEDEI